MEKGLVERLEAAVTRLETLAVGPQPLVSSRDLLDGQLLDPSIDAFDGLVGNFLKKLVAAAEKIGGQVLEATKILEQAFAVEKELLVKAKQTQKPSLEDLALFLKPLNELIVKAHAMTEGRRSDFFNHVKALADSLTALAWIAYLGKDCGISLPITHVEESWQMAEFYNNKILVQYRNKDQDHVDWAKALKELYIPGLQDYVKSFYALGPVWGPPGSAPVSASFPAPSQAKASNGKAPAPPTLPSAPLFTSETASARPKQGMSAVFEELSSGKSVTAGLRKVTDDMKTKNQADRTGLVNKNEKEKRSSFPAFSKAGPPKLELQLGRKWAVENQIGKKNLVIDECDAKQSVYVYGCKDTVLQVKGFCANYIHRQHWRLPTIPQQRFTRNFHNYCKVK
ncbi:hypothetical protein AXF42_Ash002730 [Apostasia shenzhenica]|uniref:Adenylyl cyclase-associated protein n=1 Tax=Apostasia shenzhenica TaxID=1088818 RepID=A0A2I0A767_9ASPA|nr:hypothetical protein AXF42_Ash002730 [Apostasia shenzhenica]